MDCGSHMPVMKEEVLSYLAVRPEGVYVDATFGRGGHAKAILGQLGKKGRLMAFDKDWEAILVGSAPPFCDARFSIQQGNFASLGQYMRDENMLGKVDGIFLDLGVSSPQLDNPQRGFSFRQDGPLDMRMDTRQALDAATWINSVEEKTLQQVLKEYGEERYARRIASAVVAARMQHPIVRTGQLADIIVRAVPTRERKKHPATRSFQAIRIVVNQELDALNQCLSQCLDILSHGGRLLVMSFHSLEDRIVKRFFQQYGPGNDVAAHLPPMKKEYGHRFKRIGRLVRASANEVSQNPRARSAILRVVEKQEE